MNICDSQEEVKIAALTGGWKTWIPILMDDFEGFTTSGEKANTVVVETAIELELEVGSEGVTELL